MILKNTTTEDKLSYCNKASKDQEPKFVDFINNLGGLIKLRINPAKENDPYTHDLLVNDFCGELKTQDTPFFKSKSLYGIDPQWAVTYNHKDYLRYKKNYTSTGGDIIIFFDVTRKEEAKYGVKTFPMRSVFYTKASIIERLIEKESAPLHEYTNRKNDTQGNAKNSYVIDVRKFRMIYYSGRGLNLEDFSLAF
jgi:hypothetical protein